MHFRGPHSESSNTVVSFWVRLGLPRGLSNTVFFFVLPRALLGVHLTRWCLFSICWRMTWPKFFKLLLGCNRFDFWIPTFVAYRFVRNLIVEGGFTIGLAGPVGFALHLCSLHYSIRFVNKFVQICSGMTKLVRV